MRFPLVKRSTRGRDQEIDGLKKVTGTQSTSSVLHRRRGGPTPSLGSRWGIALSLQKWRSEIWRETSTSIYLLRMFSTGRGLLLTFSHVSPLRRGQLSLNPFHRRRFTRLFFSDRG